MDLFTLVAKLVLDSAGYDKGLDDAKGKAEGFGSKVATAFKAGGAAIAAVTGVASALGGAVVKSAGEVASYGDNIDKMSQKMGLSAAAYQEWDAVMQHSGTSIEALQSGMKTLANAVENGNKAFERLGISQEDIASMNNEELFSATITALQNVENETERTYLAGQLLGRGATELGALLNTSAEDTQAMKDRVHELGGVLSDEAVKAAAGYQDSLQDMGTAFSGLKRNLVGEFLPSITSVMDGLTELFSGGDGIGKIGEGVSSFIGKLTEEIPKVVEVGSGIVIALVQAISDNLPALITAGMTAITSLVEGVAKNLPELIPAMVDAVLLMVDALTDPDTLENLINAAITLILALADGLVRAIPKLMERAPFIIKSLVTALIAEIPQILAGALQLIVSLGAGLIEAIPELVAEIPKIIAAIVGGLIEGVKDIIEVGGEIVRGLWEGIKAAWGWLVDSVKNLFGGLVDGIKNLLGIHSPSKIFASLGKNSALGFGEGFDKAMESISADIDSSMDFSEVPIRTRQVQNISSNGVMQAPKINIEFTGDLAQLARVLQPQIVNENNRQGNAFVYA